jgi:ABC-type transport system substrate-binding protein
MTQDTPPPKALSARRRSLLKASVAAAVTAVAGPARAATPFFKLYMMIPNNQPARMIWGTLAAQQMSRIGIDVVSSFVPFTVISPRRSKGDGKSHPQGGWDCYLERYYYNSIQPVPNTLFHSKLMPPAGQNYYYVNDPQIDTALDAIAGSLDEEERRKAYHAFQKRWYDTEPMTILFYPQDVIATNPKLKGFDATTFNPVFFPQPEKWTIEGAGNNATAAFASWAPPSALIPMYSIGYNESNIFGPVYNTLYEYENWETKKLVPGLATGHTMSDDGKHWVITLRQGVKWHSGEELTAEDVKFTWDTIMNKAYGSALQAAVEQIMGSTSAYKVTGKHEITIDLPAFSMLFQNWLMGSVAIMPKHAYQDIKPEGLRGHVASTWLGSYNVKTSDGKTFTARGGIGTGPWIPQGYDPARKAYRYARNENYWKPHSGNVKQFYVVNIQGTDSVLSALKAGEIDAHDPMYDIGSLVNTIDPSWGKVHTFDSYKWQHICYNLTHPVFGTGVETPLGKQDPSRAAEAAAYIRKAISHAIPREQIVKEIAGGYGEPGTVPMPWSAPEYDHETLKPIAYDLDLAREYMQKAGYTF